MPIWIVVHSTKYKDVLQVTGQCHQSIEGNTCVDWTKQFWHIAWHCYIIILLVCMTQHYNKLSVPLSVWETSGNLILLEGGHPVKRQFWGSSKVLTRRDRFWNKRHHKVLLSMWNNLNYAGMGMWRGWVTVELFSAGYSGHHSTMRAPSETLHGQY